MIVRLIAVTLLGWMLGFAWFAMFLPQPLDGRQTDAIVVLTGGAGRIDRGLALLEEGAAKRMLISGVDRSVRPVELAAEYKTRLSLFTCCITLGREAIDTRSNAIETARWLERRDYKASASSPPTGICAVPRSNCVRRFRAASTLSMTRCPAVPASPYWCGNIINISRAAWPRSLVSDP